MDNQIIDEDVDITTATLSPVGFSRPGYVVSGWNVYEISGGDKFYRTYVEADAVLNELFEKVLINLENNEEEMVAVNYNGSVIDLYAQWKVDSNATYSISFNNNLFKFILS